jgi:hypothetical protein
MQLYYDLRDAPYHEKKTSQILYWLGDLGAKPLDNASPADKGFLFAGARPIEDYRRLVAGLPFIRDRPQERAALLRLDTILATLEKAGARVPTPRTWLLPLDAPLPEDLAFPLFLRTAESSWKLGGRVSRVNTAKQLRDESEALRRALGWDALILAREWVNLAEAGAGRYGQVPQEIRVWIVDGVSFAWSFHYLNILEQPKGFPPSPHDLNDLRRLAAQVASAFGSRLVAADFARLRKGGWCFIEAGPGSCSGTAHEAVFKAVAGRLLGSNPVVVGDAVGGLL